MNGNIRIKKANNQRLFDVKNRFNSLIDKKLIIETRIDKNLLVDT